MDRPLDAFAHLHDSLYHISRFHVAILNWPPRPPHWSRSIVFLIFFITYPDFKRHFWNGPPAAPILGGGVVGGTGMRGGDPPRPPRQGSAPAPQRRRFR